MAKALTGHSVTRESLMVEVRALRARVRQLETENEQLRAAHAVVSVTDEALGRRLDDELTELSQSEHALA